MNFTFSDEQEELRRTIRRFLEDKSPSSEVRRLMETEEGYDEAVWKQMAQELGLQGLAVPERYGGQGFTAVELGIVLEEMGRALLCAPFVSSIACASTAIQIAGDDEQKVRYLPGIASGETLATLALSEPGGGWSRDSISASAARVGNGYSLNGSKSLVVDGGIAHLIIVAARTDDDVSLFVVESDNDAVTRTPLKPMDLTRKLARLELNDAPAERLGSSTWADIERILDRVAVYLSAEMTGGMGRCLDMAVEYAKNRVQFGRPIGAFQAVKHKCADMLLKVESARTAAYYGMWAAAQDDPDLARAAPLAKSYCGEAYFECASDNIQVHGGIGFTWEHDAHLYYRRAKSSELLFGDSDYHRDLLADRLGI